MEGCDRLTRSLRLLQLSRRDPRIMTAGPFLSPKDFYPLFSFVQTDLPPPPDFEADLYHPSPSLLLNHDSGTVSSEKYMDMQVYMQGRGKNVMLILALYL